MGARINQSIQNTLFLLNPLSSITSKSRIATTHFKIPLNFHKNSIFSASKSRKSSFCSCTISNGNDKNEAETFVLTTPLYYVNAPPHMGSAYTTIAADAIARFQRLLGKRVIFVTGTDEHGEKIAAAAAGHGSSPSEHCDVISQDYKTLWKDLEISYDKFIRTTDPKHEAIVKEFYSKVLANGDIYRADYEGLYCVNCEEYKDEKELLDNNCCPMHLKPCVQRKEDNYFFALSKYQKLLEEILTENPNFVQPSYRLNEDILRFHAVYWPAMLMSAGLGLPKMVFGHGFLTKDGLKMGKSLGNTLEPNELVQKFGADAVRYFFLREVEFGNDGDYSEDRFINIVNAHLANTIGNLLNRTLGLLKKNCQSTLVVDSAVAANENDFRDTVEKLVEKAGVHYESLSLSLACEAVLEIGNAGNAYMDERAPWSRFKQGGSASEAAAKDLVIILETVRIMAVALSPVAPSLCWRIYAQLGYSKDQFSTITWSETKWGGLKGGQVMAQPKPIFSRIENKTETEEDGGASSAKKLVESKGNKPQAKVAAEA
ncbi:methionine--tRNA ligase, chloroplastic/mitochondrial isoform X2 [Mercurialis annua]|uniref:methionine--tRNA ligase, chloroplastic/mitochondrial isoform X2 n=1 Tax=Mercurialis annua TaxID=3986 RepID=UPI00215E4107|nr:methionine--tRNA ligase, chloroplastic/mitochondrial isoform X2 [Mercurialis annua]